MLPPVRVSRNRKVMSLKVIQLHGADSAPAPKGATALAAEEHSTTTTVLIPLTCGPEQEDGGGR